MKPSKHRHVRLLLITLVLLVCGGIATASPPGHDHPSDLFEPPDPPAEPEDPDASEPDDPGPGDDSGEPDRSAEIEAATDDLISELEAAVRACNEAEAESAAARAATLYRDNPAGDPNQIAGAYRNGALGLRAAIDGKYAAGRVAATQRERELARLSRDVTARPVGDPIRLSDAAWQFTVAMPVIRHWGIELDLSLYYADGHGATGGDWAWVLDERVVPGAPPELELGPLLVAWQAAAGELGDDLDGWQSSIGGTVPTIQEIDRLISEWTAALARLEQVAAEAGALQDERTATRRRELIDRAVDELEQREVILPALRELRPRVADYRAARQTQAAGSSQIADYRSAAEAYAAERDKALQRQAPARPPQLGEDHLPLDAATAVLIDGQGARIHFAPREPGGPAVSKLRPWQRLYLTETGFRITGPYTERIYDRSGRLSGIQDRQGRALNILRDPDRGLTRIEDETGRLRAEIRRNPGGRISVAVEGLAPTHIRSAATAQLRPERISGPRGTLAFAYDQHHRVEAVERADGSVTRVEREDSGEGMRSIFVLQSDGAREMLELLPGGWSRFTDADGVQTRYRMDGGRVVRVEYASGFAEDLTRSAAGELLAVGDNHGRATRIVRDPEGAVEEVHHADGSWLRLVRDSAGRVVRRETDRGTEWERSFDEQGRLSSEGRAGERARVLEWEGPRELRVIVDGITTWRLEFDAAGNLRRQLRADGRERILDHDVLGRPVAEWIDGEQVRTWEYTPAGRLRSYRDPWGSVELRRPDSRSLERYINGQLYERTLRDGRDRLVLRERGDGTYLAFHYSPGGRLSEIHDAAGVRERREYDEAGLLRAVQRGDTRRETVYDQRGRIRYEREGTRVLRHALYEPSGLRSGWRYPDGSRSRRVYRSGGHLTVEDPGQPSLMVRIGASGAVRRVEHPWRGELRVQTSGGNRRIRLNGELQRQEERDHYGRPTVISYADGTQERWTYRDRGRQVVMHDRRDGRHVLSYDRIGRLLHSEQPDGTRRSWHYLPGQVVERIGNREIVHHLAPDGRIVGQQAAGMSWRDEPAARGRVRSLYAGDPSTGILRDRLMLDPNGLITGARSAAGVNFFQRDPPGPGSLSMVLNGRRIQATAGAPGEAGEFLVNLGGEHPWRIASGPGGITRIVRPDGTRSELSYHQPGIPERLSEHGPEGGRFGWSTRISPGLMERLAVDGSLLSRWEWDEGAGTMRVRSPAVTRYIRRGPYGVLREESIELAADEAPPAPQPGASVRISNRIDRAGRILERQTEIRSGAEAFSAAIRASYGPGQQPAEFDAGRLGLRIGSEGAGTWIEIAADAGAGIPVTRIRLDEGRLSVDGRVVLTERTLPGQAAWISSLTERSAAGAPRTRDALLTLLGPAGAERAEYRLDGALRIPSYSENGRLLRRPHPNGPHSPVSAEMTERLARAWRAAGVSVSRSASLLPDSAASRPVLEPRWPPASTRAPVRDASGRIVLLDGLRIAYDDTIGSVRSLQSADGRGWSVLRDADRAPVLMRSVERNAAYVATTLHAEGPAAGLSLRLWRRTERQVRAPVERYRSIPRGAADLAAAREDSTRAEALELLLNGRLIAIITRDTVRIPLFDRRETLRGLGTYRRADGYLDYTRLPDPGGSGRAPELPEALPWSDIRYGYLQLPGQSQLWSPSRLLLPDYGVFSSRDPALHGLDWYGYAFGDPINFRDPGGAFVVPVGEGLSDHQQNERWAKEGLGGSESFTLGTHGCLITAVSNVINAVSRQRVTDPGTLNRQLVDTEFFLPEGELGVEINRDIIAAATGRHIEQVSFNPAEVNMERVAAYLNESGAGEFMPIARITSHPAGQPEAKSYLHFLNVSSLNADGEPVFRDTSSRGRTELADTEELTRYDVYVSAPCRSY